MKHLSFLFVFFAVTVLSANESTIVPTGHQPLAIHTSGNIVHVFCNGDDKDYDGIYEANADEKPATWVMHDISTGSQVQTIVMQQGYFTIPFRPAFSSTKMYHPRGNRIEVFDIKTASLIDTSFISIDDPKVTITAVHVITEIENGIEQEKYIAYSHKSSFTDKGSFSIFDIAQKRVIAMTEVGINPQLIRSFRNTQGDLEYLVLSEGTFGGKNSTLHRLLPTPTMTMPFTITTFELGDTGNHFDIVDQLALVLMNGSHEVFAINLVTNQLLPGSFPVGTVGYDGPRELIIDPNTNQVFISTYASDIRIGSLDDGTMLDAKATHGKAEGMALIGGNLWVCNAFKKGEYAVDSVLNIVPLDMASSIDTEDIHANIVVHGGILSIASICDFSDAELHIINAHGNIIIQQRLSGNQQYISLNGLPHGVYGISIRSGAKEKKCMIIHAD
ncbi:MAG: hypothetical protein RL734_1046 [Bacteroidota bacterium]